MLSQTTVKEYFLGLQYRICLTQKMTFKNLQRLMFREYLFFFSCQFPHLYGGVAVAAAHAQQIAAAENYVVVGVGKGPDLKKGVKSNSQIHPCFVWE